MGSVGSGFGVASAVGSEDSSLTSASGASSVSVSTGFSGLDSGAVFSYLTSAFGSSADSGVSSTD